MLQRPQGRNLPPLIKTGSGQRGELTQEGSCNTIYSLFCVLGGSQNLCVTVGKDVATSVEVHWPDGRSAVRPLVPSDLNSVLEIQYPRDVEVTPTAQIQVQIS